MGLVKCPIKCLIHWLVIRQFSNEFQHAFQIISILLYCNISSKTFYYRRTRISNWLWPLANNILRIYWFYILNRYWCSHNSKPQTNSNQDTKELFRGLYGLQENYDLVIVGAGLSGAVIAEQASSRSGLRVKGHKRWRHDLVGLKIKMLK